MDLNNFWIASFLAKTATRFVIARLRSNPENKINCIRLTIL